MPQSGLKIDKLLWNTLLLVMSLVWFNAPVYAALKAPADLKEWSDWVLHDVKDYTCPMLHNADSRQCLYPSDLTLKLNKKSGTFEQQWTVIGEFDIPLPGEDKYWPLNVRVNDKATPVVSHKGKPVIHLKSGRYVIKGEFTWKALPESLFIPASSGLVQLFVNWKPVLVPDLQGERLWLKSDDQDAIEGDRTELKVFRKIIDEVPMQIETRLVLDVAGDQRELKLKGALLDGFNAAYVKSVLPARLDSNGFLSLKVRPGHWEVVVGSRGRDALVEVSLDTFNEPWPVSELWVFDARNHLRLVKVTSPDSIDASRSALPDEWKSFPAYLLNANNSLKLEVVRRGDPDPEPDKLQLTRKYWLDFEGNALTVNDKITGSLSRSWRLNAGEDLELGQVSIDGQPQFITRLGDSKGAGVEVRQGSVNLDAYSRITQSASSFSAVGWDHDFDRVNATLTVPPGWELFAAVGVDHSPGSWISRWTLLDFFIVLITSIALYKIYGMRWGILSIAALVVLWHEPGAPNYIWLNLAVAVSLLKLVTVPRIRRMIYSYLILSSLTLMLISLPFIVDQVRTGLYPQLEFSRISVAPEITAQVSSPVSARLKQLSSRDEMEMDDQYITEEESGYMGRYSDSISRVAKKVRPDVAQGLVQDPSAKLQTGPGVPRWSWRDYNFSWNGPVSKDQQLSLYMINPALNFVLNLIRVLFVLVLAWLIIGDPIRDIANKTKKMGSSAVSVVLLVLLSVLMMPEDSYAAYPSKEILQELKKRLLEPAECLPACADIEKMNIKLTPNDFSISLRVHAQENLVLPLPVPLKQWMPSKVNLDERTAKALFRDKNGMLWIYVKKGVHKVFITGKVRHLRSLQISLPLQPHKIDLNLKGWGADGNEDVPELASAISFTRQRSTRASSVNAEESTIPVFARVTRYLSLGLDWRVNTTVELVTGNALPAVIRIPLIRGESVITDGINVSANSAVITLSNQKRIVQWNSTLKRSDAITLKAPQNTLFWSEVWRVSVSPVWHMQYSGIPVVYHQRLGNQWLPEWQPWAGEKVRLNITRPEGVQGSTLTVDQSLLYLEPGDRTTAVTLKLDMRSSQGQQHKIVLPDKAVLELVEINGSAVPVRQDGAIVLLPISPGHQAITLKWKEERGIGSLFTSSVVDMGVPSVNNKITINPGFDRWILLLGGVDLGPAVLFWGVLLVIILFAVLLGRFKGTPLRTHSWVLLGIGLSASLPFTSILIVVWIFALYARSKLEAKFRRIYFNLMQVGLIFLTVVSLLALLVAIEQGLLGSPDMQISGNGSSRYALNWFQDRTQQFIPEVWIISVPVLVYRSLMLLWSMWMAFALINWLKWGWQCYSTHGYWRSEEKQPDDNKSNGNEAVKQGKISGDSKKDKED